MEYEVCFRISWIKIYVKKSKINYCFYKYHTVCSKQTLYFVNILAKMTEDWNFKCKTENTSYPPQALHGFAPSATISIRSEERLMSLWSRCATNAQCMSLDFTQATFAAIRMGRLLIQHIKAIEMYYQFVLLTLTIKHISVYSWFLPLYWQTFCIHDSGFTFIKEYGILITCIMFMTLWNQIR